MSKITCLDDFNKITSNITSFSHAYLFNVNSLSNALPYIKSFAKRVICGQYNDNCLIDCDICYKIDNDEFDDLYIVNPDTIGINTIEIEKLLHYMSTKSTRNNGKRVYIIYGMERLSRDISNKILKFLEEPEDNIYALLMTENYEQILPTITSRCQVINLVFDSDFFDEITLTNAIKLLKLIINKGNSAIAYTSDNLGDIIKERVKMDDFFSMLEKILSTNINKRYCDIYDKRYDLNELDNYDINVITNILDITNKLRVLIKKNINLNLLIDRYIIEISKELNLCKK